MLPDDAKLRVVMERKPPVCYHCRERGHIKATCPQASNDILWEDTIVEEDQEIPNNNIELKQIEEERY